MASLRERFNQVNLRAFPSEAGKGQIGSIEFNIWLSQMVGVPLPPSFVPLRRRPLINGLLLTYGCTLTFLHFCYVLFEFYDMYIYWSDFYAFTQNFCLSMSHFSGALKISNLLFHLGTLQGAILKLKHVTKTYIKTEKQLQIFARAELQNKLFLIIYATVVGFTGFTAMIMLFIVSDPDMAGKIFPFRITLPAWLPFYMQVAYIGVTDFMFAVQIVTVDYLNISMINLLRCHLNIIKSTFDELILDEQNARRDMKRDPNARMADIVEHHCILKSVRDDVEYIFNLAVLLQFFTSLIVSAVTGFQATMHSSNSNSMMIMYFYCFCIFTELFGYCWFGQEVNEQNNTLAARGYGSSWYHFDQRFRKSLAIFLLNAQQPFNFTGGGFIDLSLPSFTNVMSKAYSFIAVLHRMYGR
ncbi:odorant receptor 85b-like [Zeugodacus cucurbitae]|uniref:odorant receptor 85b-like n=1 Tax=Zeugodacus cucurbitae TaxID=28588 RepID=UPI0023D90206|nr:odorant receptor 85b-like [Zeugodacus cucurbitae]